MRKYEIESERLSGCIKNLDIAGSGDIFRAVGVVNMTRSPVVLDLLADVLSSSESDLYFTDRWWLTH